MDKMNNNSNNQGKKLADQLTPEQKSELKDAFSMFDRDNDGSITSKELGTVMRSLGQNPSEQDLQNMILQVDLDNNGSIELDEFFEMMAKRMLNDNSAEDEIEEIFREFDKDDDGHITAGELRYVFSSLGEKLTLQDCQALISSVAKEGASVVTKEEFKKLMKELL